jgi:hypothetical protein
VENLTRSTVEGGGIIRNRDSVAVIAPTSARARSAAAFLAGRLSDPLSPFALRDYLASRRRPRRIVLCPLGRSVASDVDFLKAARERVLWDAPEEIVYSAIEGLLGSIPPAPGSGVGRRRVPGSAPRAGETAAALLLEGNVTSARAKAIVSPGPRLWIVEHPGRIRVDSALMEKLRREGVRWAALRPSSVVALLASPRLARARRRWAGLLPRGTLVWIRKEP